MKSQTKLMQETYGLLGVNMNNVFTCSSCLLSGVTMFPVIRPGTFKFSKNPSSGLLCPPKEENYSMITL